MRNPICLGAMRSQKSKLIKHSTNMNVALETKHQKYIKKELKERSSNYIPEDQMCSLRCLENLTSGLVTESNVSSVYYPVGDTTTGLQDSHATMINIGGN